MVGVGYGVGVGGGRRMARTRAFLRRNDELQALLRLMTCFGETQFRVARYLELTNWDMEKAARLLGMEAAAIRQAVQRIYDRARAMMGGVMCFPDRQRPAVRYGAGDGLYKRCTETRHDEVEL